MAEAQAMSEGIWNQRLLGKGGGTSLASQVALWHPWHNGFGNSKVKDLRFYLFSSDRSASHMTILVYLTHWIFVWWFRDAIVHTDKHKRNNSAPSA